MNPKINSTGKRDAVNFTAAFPGKYIQGANALAELPKLFGLLGENALILASPTVKNKILPKYFDVEAGNHIHVDEFRGECCENEINRLLDIIGQKKLDVVAGIGGGKTIDTAKIVADKAGIPVIVVPTIASTDAPCSGCAVLYTELGIFDSVYYLKMNPQVVLVDTGIIASAPVRFLVAGMGDALATWFEARSCERTFSKNECGGYSTLAGLNLAGLCYETLLLYGPAAKIANENNVITPALNHVIEANILLSGIGFESSGLATAHSIHNGLTVLKETHLLYHGEKVAFGVLAGLHLNDSGPDEMEEVYSFCEEMGLPTTFSDLGITDVHISRLMDVAIKACAAGEGIHHEAVEISPERILDAMVAADAMGKARKREN